MPWMGYVSGRGVSVPASPGGLLAAAAALRSAMVPAGAGAASISKVMACPGSDNSFITAKMEGTPASLEKRSSMLSVVMRRGQHARRKAKGTLLVTCCCSHLRATAQGHTKVPLAGCSCVSCASCV
jgi:hypothetical protein